MRAKYHIKINLVGLITKIKAISMDKQKVKCCLFYLFFFFKKCPAFLCKYMKYYSNIVIVHRFPLYLSTQCFSCILNKGQKAIFSLKWNYISLNQDRFGFSNKLIPQLYLWKFYISNQSIFQNILKEKHNLQVINLSRSSNTKPLTVWFYARVDLHGKTRIFFLTQQDTPNHFSYHMRILIFTWSWL